ncbi:hypothetical protein MZM54_02635 [[Brevibacterium] frigoritolerans]|nr:hypothetical protein [Peribacillus frigoritolerans]
MTNETGNEILQDVLATYGVLLEEHFKVNPFNIDWKQSSSEFAGGDEEKFGMVLIDLHLFYQVEIDYEANTEFEVFPTLQHAWNHVVDKILVKKGFDPTTLKPAH